MGHSGAARRLHHLFSTFKTCREKGVSPLNAHRCLYILAYSESRRDKKYTSHCKCRDHFAKNGQGRGEEDLADGVGSVLGPPSQLRGLGFFSKHPGRECAACPEVLIESPSWGWHGDFKEQGNGKSCSLSVTRTDTKSSWSQMRPFL